MKNLLPKLLGASALLVVGTVVANADPVDVTIDGTTYAISVENLVAGNPSSTTLLQDQVWYGNNVLAGEFAAAVGNQLGYQEPGTYEYDGDEFGPLFNTNISGNSEDSEDLYYDSEVANSYFDIGAEVEQTYAVATPVDAQVSDGGATLALFGAALGGLILLRRRLTRQPV